MRGKATPFFVDLDYENVPAFCTHCWKIGHHIDICKFLNKTDGKDSEVMAKRKAEEAKKKEIYRKKELVKQGKHAQDPIIVDEGRNAEKHRTSENLHNNMHKAGSSGIKKTAETQHQNQFEALSKEGEVQEHIKDAMRAHDEELEREINEELNSNEETNSLSEFVNATQLDDGNNEIEDEQQVDSDPHEAGVDLLVKVDEETRRAEIEKRNMEFLNQSWANMAEDEEAEQNLLKSLEETSPEKQVNDDDGFQVVKSKGRVAKKKNIAVRSNYSTRGNTGNPKPFK